MSALWSKAISIVVSIVVDKIFGAIGALIAQWRRDKELRDQAADRLKELTDAKTKEEVDEASKNTLGL